MGNEKSGSKDVLDASDQASDESLEEHPWEIFCDPSGGIVCDESKNIFVDVGTAIIFVSVGYYLLGELAAPGTQDDLFSKLVCGVFLLIGVAIGARSIRGLIRRKKFGVSTFTVQNRTGRVGGSLSGTLRCSTDIRPTGDLKLSLECVEKRVSSGADDKSHVRYTTLWRGDQSVSYQSSSLRSGIGINFELPSGLKKSNQISGDGQIQWILRIKAPTPGMNYKAEFVVPVF